MVSNPLSGGNAKGLNDLRRLLAGYDAALHRQATDAEEIREAVLDFLAHEIDLLVINGGDGTVHAVLTALFTSDRRDRLPLLAILRAGTESMIARDVGLRGTRANALSRLLNWAGSRDREASVIERPVLCVDGAENGRPMYGMFFGAAGVYEGIKFCVNRIHGMGVRGEPASGLTLARFLLAGITGDTDTLPTSPVRFVLDGVTMQSMDASLILATTLERLFLRIRPFWGTEPEPLHFTAVRTKPKHALRALPVLIMGKKSRLGTFENGYVSHNARKIRLDLQSGFTVDGQLYRPAPQLGPLTLSHGGSARFLNL
jgi:hypothetical protein